MRLGFFVNTVLSGFAVLAVWFLDYHYYGRLRKKLDGAILDTFRETSARLQTVQTPKHLASVNLDDYFYLPDDTVYVELFNFSSPTPAVGVRIAELFEEVYRTKLAAMHRVRVYIKYRRLKKGQEVSLDEPSAFQNSHLGAQTFYYLRILNGDRNDEVRVKGNVVSVTASPEQLASTPYLQALVGKSLYHFKRLATLRSHAGGQPLLDVLREVYMARLRRDFSLHVDALAYINANKNLVFLDHYRHALEVEAPTLDTIWRSDQPVAVWPVVEKRDLAIYTTVYMFEEY